MIGDPLTPCAIVRHLNFRCHHPDRLLRLADLLDKDADNPKGVKFSLDGWGNLVDEENPKAKLKVSCDTKACAMGLAVLSGIFKKEGLRNLPEVRSAERGDDEKIVTIIPALVDKKGALMSRGFEAAAELFGITANDSYWLFHADEYPDGEDEDTPHDANRKGARGEHYVAQRIRNYVEACPQ